QLGSWWSLPWRGVANPSGVLAPDGEEEVSPTLGYPLRCSHGHRFHQLRPGPSGRRQEVGQDLRDDEHETWFDQKLEGGQPWWDTVLSEIRKSEIFVTALTPESLESQACQRELKYALDLKRPVLPIRLSAAVRPEFLSSYIHELQVVDYFEQDVQTLKSLQRAIKKLSKAPPLPDPLPEPPAIPVSYVVNLSNLIDSDSELNKDQQMKLVFEF